MLIFLIVLRAAPSPILALSFCTTASNSVEHFSHVFTNCHFAPFGGFFPFLPMCATPAYSPQFLNRRVPLLQQGFNGSGGLQTLTLASVLFSKFLYQLFVIHRQASSISISTLGHFLSCSTRLPSWLTIMFELSSSTTP